MVNLIVITLKILSLFFSFIKIQHSMVNLIVIVLFLAYYYLPSRQTMGTRFREIYKWGCSVFNIYCVQKWDALRKEVCCEINQVSSLGRPLSKKMSTYGISESRCAREMHIMPYAREFHWCQTIIPLLLCQSSSQWTRTQNPGKSDPDFTISETIADRANLRALSKINICAKVSNQLSDLSQVSYLLSNTQLKVGKMCNLEKKMRILFRL